MRPKTADGAEALIAPLYLVAILLLATPLVDFLASIIPPRPGNVEWRFASAGLLSGFLLTPLLGIALLMVVAHFAGHRRFQRLLAILTLTLCVTFVVMVLAFLLDVFQLRGGVQDEVRDSFNAAWTKAIVKHLSFVVALGWMSWSGFRMSRWTTGLGEREPAAVVVGR